MRSSGSTTMPPRAPTARPASRASSSRGRMPAEITTMSTAQRLARRRARSPRPARSPTSACGCTPRCTWTPSCAIARRRTSPPRGVDLARHQARRDLDDVRRRGRGRAPPSRPRGRADRRRSPPPRRARRPGADRVEILDRAVDEDAGQRRCPASAARTAPSRSRARGVVVDAAAADGLDGARGAIDRDDAIAEMESDVALRIPHDVRELQIVGVRPSKSALKWTRS